VNWSVIAIVQIEFFKKELAEKDIEEIVEELRPNANIDNLNIHTEKITFFMWGDKELDYAIMEKIKSKLNSLGYSDFGITADEYVKSGKGYRYMPARR